MECDTKSNHCAPSEKEAMATTFPKHKIKVLLLESIAKTATDVFVSEGYQVETAHRLTTEELKQKIRNFHVIGIRSKTKLTQEVLDCADQLIVIGHFCIGTDQTDLLYASHKGIPVFNAPFANTRSVAELIIAEMIMLARQAGDRNNEMHRRVWNKLSRGCHEIRGKTLGIIGYGHVGQQLSVLAEGVGMNVIFYDVVPKLNIGNAKSCESLQEVLKTADFVSLHVPLTNVTRNMIDKEQVDMMKDGSYLLNASRGKVVVLEPVAAALKSGKLSGAAFDVYPSEPGAKTDSYENALQNCPNTILTPHIGGATEEAQSTIGQQAASILVEFLNAGTTNGAVNFPEVALPRQEGTHRIVNAHKDHPGVLKQINDILSDYNITAQSLSTKNGVGYLICEIDNEVSAEAKGRIEKMPDSLTTRVFW